MAIEIGDLWPFSSGTSSLGAEMVNGGFTGEIRPFGHIHMFSGVFNDPVQSLSGIVRYGRTGVSFLAKQGLELSLDGGNFYDMGFYVNVTSLNPRSYSFVTDGNWSWLATNTLQLSSGGDVNLLAFGGSGNLLYRFGPHESWYIKPSHSVTGGPFNDGYWPIAHSGNVAQMIAQGGGAADTLQTVYNAGRVAVLTSSPGDLQIIANTSKPEFSTFGTQPELNMSGLFTPPTLSNLETGDFYMMNHSVISGIVGTTTSAVAKAQALGPGTLVVQTGSGIVNVMTGSGIAQFECSTNQTLTTSNATITTLDRAIHAADQNYSINAGIITVYSPGLYKVDFTVSFSKTAGSTIQHAQASLVVNGAGLQGTTVSCLVANTTTAITASNSKTVLVNLDAGDTLALQGVMANIASNTIRVDRFNTTFIIQKIGPKRGAAGS